MSQINNVVALAGGVGGAKLAMGLQEVLAPGQLAVIVNTGDDFEHWGLNICPDLDTVMYNLAGVHHPEQGWGRNNETFTALETMEQLGGEDWFTLGDRDLALHLRRTEWLNQGISLTEVTDRLRRTLGVPSQILPMSDSPVHTLVHTEEGDLPFQHYFVRRRCEPIMIALSFVGAETARVSEMLLDAIDSADLIVFCPSNPYLSLDPILSIPTLRSQLLRSRTPKIAVSPIVNGAAIKGPAAKLMKELGEMISPLTVVDRYADFLDGFVLDRVDAILEDSIKIPVLVTNTLMDSLSTKKELAGTILNFAHTIHPTANSAQKPKVRYSTQNKEESRLARRPTRTKASDPASR